MKELNTGLLSIKKWLFFLAITACLLLISFSINYLYFSESVVQNTYAEQMALDRISQLFETQKKFLWLIYLLTPLMLIIRILYNTLWLTTLSLFVEYEGHFKAHFNISLKAEYVFVAMAIARLLWLIFLKEVNTMNDLGYIPFSLVNLYNVNTLPKWAIYPLQLINIWEVLFCWAGTSLYASRFNMSLSASFKRFCIPYLTGLLVWVLAVVFISLIAS